MPDYAHLSVSEMSNLAQRLLDTEGEAYLRQFAQKQVNIQPDKLYGDFGLKNYRWHIYGDYLILGDIPRAKEQYRYARGKCVKCGKERNSRVAQFPLLVCHCSYHFFRLDVKNKRFGKLVVLYDVAPSKQYKRRVRVRCDCGTVKVVLLESLSNKKTVSCGCEARARLGNYNRTHGMTGTKEFRCWVNAREGATRKSCHMWRTIGARGLTVCDRWMNSFENFYADMGKCPPGCILVRKDEWKDYSPENCFWETKKKRWEQKSEMVTWKGVSKTKRQWCEETEIPLSTVYSVMKRENVDFVTALQIKIEDKGVSYREVRLRSEIRKQNRVESELAIA